MAGVLPLVDAAGAAALAAGAVDVEVDAAARWARIVGGGGDASGAARAPRRRPRRAWRAQRADAVLLRVTWATADAAPPALDVADVRVACAPRAVAVDAASAARNARFALALEPYAPVARCLYEPGAVGRGVLTLEKRRRARWPRLERDSARPRPNTWWDRQEQFRDELVGLPDDGADADAAPRPPAAPPAAAAGRPRRSRSARASPTSSHAADPARRGPSGGARAAARARGRLRPAEFARPSRRRRSAT